MSDYSHVLEDTIFPSFIRSCVPNLDLTELKKECYSIQEREPSVQASNHGGYHSRTKKNMDGCENYNNLGKLIQTVKSFSQDTADHYDLNIDFLESYWWFNINKAYQYNFVHHHFRADLIGVFYASAPRDSGNLTIVRKDGSEYGRLYSRAHNMLEIEIGAETGRLYLIPGHLWHYVKCNESQEDRISVSFNIYFA